ncbi:twin-arginine translocation signal domain-containing protein [Streptomyces sp. NBC_00094]|uniref:twin-arginine translocation signal domain-containing protein n=1 Tax=Streptomyces sp. NBC_00094 TaxID=2903620 RepID=UPI0022522969|nr:twin-arginine translocation signal domain-containing protein [Streptomyces sp. NBC_00094]MCX5388440.1 twin-arginine translocation signal domain-containing protein [Streptomyces sp. NBC_00094]
MTTRRSFLGRTTAVGVMAGLAASPAAAEDGSGAPADALAGRRRGARDAIVAVNSGMRSHYAALKSDLIAQLSPVLVVQNDAKGGRFTLVHDGTQESLHPVGEVFELAKSVSHVPLGVFSIIAPHLSGRIPNVPGADRIDSHDLAMVAFKDTANTDWITPLRQYADTLAAARRELDQAGIPPEMVVSCERVLDGALSFIQVSTEARSFDIRSFEDFSHSVYAGIRTNMRYAAEAQIAGVQDILRKWRARIGEEAWRDLYTVVLSQWATSELNQNSIIIRPCMNPAKVSTHLIDLPAAEPLSDPVSVALDNLARIVQDNIAAELVFPSDRAAADALKGPQDLLADEILDQLSAATPGAAAHSEPVGAGRGVCPVTRRGSASQQGGTAHDL